MTTAYVSCTLMYSSQCPCHALYHEEREKSVIHCGLIASHKLAGTMNVCCSAFCSSFVPAG